MKYPIKKHKGIGLIEVLITTLVVALGLLAVASLQGNLMGTSGENKIRAEAKMLCETKLEQLRDTIVKGAATSTTVGEYNAIVSSTAADTINGTNETFTRAWTVTNQPTAATTNPASKQINVTCSWGNADAEHQIMVQSIIAYESLGVATAIAKSENSGGVAVGNPSANANSSTVIYDSTTELVPDGSTAGSLVSTTPNALGQYIKVNSDGTTGSIVYKCTGETATADIIPFIAFEHDLYTRRVHNDGSGSFKEAIELAKSNHDGLFGGGVDSCTRKIRYNGGIILPIRGSIYSSTGNTYLLVASESGIYCYPSSITSGPYSCYVGGNCIRGPVGTHRPIPNNTTLIASAGNDTTVFECPSHPTDINYTGTAPYASDVYTSVGEGGWRGRIGFIDRIFGNAANDTVCLYDSGGTAVDDSARGYITRWSSSTSAKDLGINRPSICHDFLVGNCTAGTLKLAYSKIIRDLSASSGTPSVPVDPADKRFCHVITGTMPSGVTTPPTVTASSGYFSCTVTGSNYECDGTSKVGTGITVASGATTCTVPTLTTSNNYGTSGTTLTCNLGGAATTTTTTAGTTTTTAGTTTTTAGTTTTTGGTTSTTSSSSSTSSTSTTTSTTTTTTAGVTCNVAVSGSTAVKQTAVTSNLGCSVTSAANKAYTCPTVNSVANGTVVTMTNTGQANKTFTVACPKTAYTISWP